MVENQEKIRLQARTARENCLNTSKGEDYIEKQVALAREQYEKLLKLCPNDMEAKVYCAYYEAYESINIKAQHEPAAKKMMAALDVFAEDLKNTSLTLQEKETIIADITTRVMVLAKSFNYQGVNLELVLLHMSILLGGDALSKNLADLEAEFAIDIALTVRMAGLLLEHPDDLQSTHIRASVVVSCQSALELLVESPSFPLADNYDSSHKKLNLLLDAMNAVDPTGFHYIPLPNFKWCDYERIASFHQTLRDNFDGSKIAQEIKAHNAKVSQKERATLQAANRAKTAQYWKEHPNRMQELEDETERIRQSINANEAKITELNKQRHVSEAECEREPIPAIAEKKMLQQKLKELENQKSALGLLQITKKIKIKSEIKATKEAYEKSQKDELEQKEAKRKKKASIAKDYQLKIDQIRKANDRLRDKARELGKKMINPLGLDPL